MKSIEELRLTAKAVRERARIQREKALERAIRENIEYLEKAISEAAEHGQYEAMSDNLWDSRYAKGSGYLQEEMGKMLKGALIEYFSALGFSCEGSLSNYLTISWEEDEK